MNLIGAVQKVLMVAFVVVLGMGLFTLAQGQQISWKAQTVLNPGHMATDAEFMLAKEFEKRTNGNCKIELFPSVGLGLPPHRMLATVGQGLLDAAEIWGGHVAGDLRILELVNLHNLVPYNIPLRKKIATTLFPFYEKALREKFNIQLIYAAQAEPRNIGTRKPVARFTDLKGMKIRSEGLVENEITKAAGAHPLTMPYGEVFTALQQGILDGYWLPPSPTYLARVYEVSKYFLQLDAAGSSWYFIVNLDKFKALPPDYQKILMRLGPEAMDFGFDRCESDTIMYTKKLIDAGMVYTKAHPDDMKFLNSMAPKVWDMWVAGAEPEAKVMMEKVKFIVADWEKGRK